MATAQMDTVVWHLRRAVLPQDRAGSTDGQLLASFIERKDAAAFEALVRRHGPMVFGVCRRIVGNHHDAEDAFQATFLVLARKAPSVRPRERVANWLHGVALRTALKARTMTTKRRGREKQLREMPEPEAAQQGQWRDLQPLLDQELNGLPENYRLPILLCDLESKTIKGAAQQLGWPEGTLAGRLARGRKLLAKRLANRGVVLSAGSLAAVVSPNGASAGVPVALMGSTVKAATMLAAGRATVAGVIPAKVAILTEGVLKAMLLTKLKSVVAVTVAMVVTVSIGAALLGCGTAAGQQTEGKQADSVAPDRADKGKRPILPPARQKDGDTDTASSYERTGHPRAAVFYRQLAAERHKKASEGDRLPAVPPRATGQREYVITSRLLEAGPDRPKVVLRLPRATVDAGQLIPIHISDGPQNLLAKVVDDEKMKIGTFFDVRVTRLRGNKVRLFCSLQRTEVEKSSVSEIRVLGNSVQAIRDMELHKPVKVVFQKDARGAAQRWVEITVDEIGAGKPPVPTATAVDRGPQQKGGKK